MRRLSYLNLPSIPHAGYLGEYRGRPAYLGLTPGADDAEQTWPFYSAGLSGQISVSQTLMRSEACGFLPGKYQLRCFFLGQLVERLARLRSDGRLETRGKGLMAEPGQAFLAELEQDGQQWTVLLREQESTQRPEGYTQVFDLYRTVLSHARREITDAPQHHPEHSMMRLRVAMGEQRSLYPLQLAPSVLDLTGRRLPLRYDEAIERLADLVLAHRPPYGRTLVYMDGNCDTFAQFALQEVGRLLGVRNLYGSSAWGGRAVAEAALLQQGNTAPMLTADQAFSGSRRLYLLSGWNGLVTHPALFERLLQRDDLDAWLIDTVVSESAKVLADRLGPDRVVLLKPGAEPYLVLALAHEIFHRWPEALNTDFIHSQADTGSFDEFAALARADIFAPDAVAELLVPEPDYAPRLRAALSSIAAALVHSDSVPVHLPGSGLTQSSGVVGVALWQNLLAMLGKWGFDGPQLRGGVLRSFESQSEGAQMLGLDPDHFFGCLSMDKAGAQEAARRMGLPPQTYLPLLQERAHPIQELPLVAQGHQASAQRELIICIGNGMESRLMRDNALWLQKLRQNEVTLVLIDAQPGPLCLQHAALILPPTLPVAAHRALINGEGRLIQSFPRRQAPPETRTEATVLYDLMAEVSRFLREEPEAMQGHRDLASLAESGYLQARFEPPEWGWGGQLPRMAGEVSRPRLWERLQQYLGPHSDGGPELAPLFCRFDNARGEALSWSESLEGAFSRPAALEDLHRQPGRFRFFVPDVDASRHTDDLAIPAGPLLNFGSAMPAASYGEVRYSIASSTDALPLDHAQLPRQRHLFISAALAVRLQLAGGDAVRLQAESAPEQRTAAALHESLQIATEIKGEMVYLHHYPSRDELANRIDFPWLRFEAPVCPYSQVPLLKKIQIQISKDTDHA